MLNYYEDFDDPQSGWLLHESLCCLTDCDNAREHLEYKYDLFYQDGRYHVFVPLDCLGGGENGGTRHIYPAVLAPGIHRPENETCIQAAGGLEQWDAHWAFWGLVFAAAEDLGTVFTLEVNNLGDWAVVKRTGYQFPGPNHSVENEERQYLVSYTGGHRPPALAGLASNTLKARITGQQVWLYINDQ